MKKKDGSVQEWMRCQMANGNMVWHGSCPKTGKEVKIYYEKFTCLDGTWKPVCIEGAEEMAKAMGKLQMHYKNYQYSVSIIDDLYVTILLS